MANNTLPKSLPMGRLHELESRSDAHLIAYSTAALFQGYRITRYKSRKALEAFCRPGSVHHALVKTPTHPNMITNRNVQREPHCGMVRTSD